MDYQIVIGVPLLIFNRILKNKIKNMRCLYFPLRDVAGNIMLPFPAAIQSSNFRLHHLNTKQLLVGKLKELILFRGTPAKNVYNFCLGFYCPKTNIHSPLLVPRSWISRATPLPALGPSWPVTAYLYLYLYLNLTPTHFQRRGQEWVELYLYPLSGPFRACYIVPLPLPKTKPT
jgi:hypothetical protein